MQGSEPLVALGSRLFAAWTLYLLSEYGSVKELVQAVQAVRTHYLPGAQAVVPLFTCPDSASPA